MLGGLFWALNEISLEKHHKRMLELLECSDRASCYYYNMPAGADEEKESGNGK